MTEPIPAPIVPGLTYADFETEERARTRARAIVERTFLASGSSGVESYRGANAKPRVLAAMLDLRAVPDEALRTILLSHHVSTQADLLLSRHETWT